MKVSETHANGASIALSGRRHEVVKILEKWRSGQQPADPEPAPDKQGADAQVERSASRYFEVRNSGWDGQEVPIVQARSERVVGFTLPERITP